MTWLCIKKNYLQSRVNLQVRERHESTHLKIPITPSKINPRCTLRYIIVKFSKPRTRNSESRKREVICHAQGILTKADFLIRNHVD
jgi:hypothetical protein